MEGVRVWNGGGDGKGAVAVSHMEGVCVWYEGGC